MLKCKTGDSEIRGVPCPHTNLRLGTFDLSRNFTQRRPKETRLALLKDINTRVATAAGVSPDDMLITLYEVSGENISFGQGEAQRAKAVAHA